MEVRPVSAQFIFCTVASKVLIFTFWVTEDCLRMPLKTFVIFTFAFTEFHALDVKQMRKGI